MLSFFRTDYMEWKDYKERVDFIDLFLWQQAVRRESIRNTE